MESLFAVYINAFFYVLLLFFSWKKNKKYGPAEVLVSLYAIVALLGIFYYNQNPHSWSLEASRFFYLFVVFCFFYYPISEDRNIEVYSTKMNNSRFYHYVAWFYIIIAVYSCIVYIPQVILVLQNPDWSNIYAEAHSKVQTDVFTKIANAFFHIRYMGIILFFSFLIEKKSTLFMWLLGVSAFLPVLVVTMLNASRGGVVSLFFSLYLTYKMFEPSLPSKVGRWLKTIAIMIAPILILYFVQVSVSRFDVGTTEYESSNSSYIAYLGQSMLLFNYGVMDNISGFSEGGYMFDNEVKLGQIRGTHFGSGFITFIGCIYLDFGFWGTLLFALLTFFLLKALFNKRKLGIPELFILLTYVMFVFNGVFVSGRGYGHQWVEAFVIYILLKKTETLITTKKRIIV